MKNIISSYLTSSDKSKENMKDIFSFYATGKMKNYLSNQLARNLEFFPSVQKDKGSLQVCFQYYNLCVVLEFDETGYEYSIYTPNCSADDLERSIVSASYNNDFLVEGFLDDFMGLLRNDGRIVKTKEVVDKKKLYKTISSICYVLTFLLIAIPSAYVLITHDTIQAGPWVLVLILIPFAISQVFDFLASKN